MVSHPVQTKISPQKNSPCELKARWTEFHFRITRLHISDICILSIYAISICLFISPFQQSIPYGTSRPHSSVRMWDFHIWAYKNHFLADSMQKKKKKSKHGHQPIARMQQQPTCFCRLTTVPHPPTSHEHTHTQSTHSHKHNQTCLSPAVMNDAW